MGTDEEQPVGSARGEGAGPGAGARGPATQVDAQAPRMLAGRYLLGARLGRGGMGTVWRAQDQMLDREVAVKELSVGHLAEEDLAIVQSRMKQEARAAARIKHPGVITIHDVLEQDGKPWIVMELIDGRSLAELVEQEGTLNPREAAGIGAQVLAALHRGHLAGVIHRDVKPANVLLERGSGRVVLTDFGIATFEGDSALTRTGDLIGSPDYLAPERVHGSRPGPESDLWGLGATLYAAVEGQSPFRRESPLTTLAAVVADPLPEPRNAGALAPVLHALMSKDPAERPSAPEAIRMLERVAAGETTNISVPPSTLRSPTEAVPVVDRSEPDQRDADGGSGRDGGRGRKRWEARTVRNTAAPAAERGDGRPAEHAHAPTVKSEPIRPTFVEHEYRHPGPPPGSGGAGQRPAPGGSRRRLWPWLTVAALLAALAGGGAAYELSRRHSTGSAGPAQHSLTSAPSASATPNGTTQGGYSRTIPTGYSAQHDPAGFTFPLPNPTPGFTWVNIAHTSLGAIDYSPDSGRHLLRFAVTAGQGITPLEHAKEMEKSVISFDASYQLQSMEPDQLDGFVGARWEYTFVRKADGVPHHAMEQLFKDDKGTEYDILVDYPQSDWQTGYQRFLDIVNGFSTP
ncbi:serine/threonine-protein kinase [Streptacidiphilus sp. EB129]|uniref:serine/threonine-protein kinase n=1 Tax=Streptacidiphilus sp. EB129 TaxID=3156262 RepID=UPI003513DF47